MQKKSFLEGINLPAAVFALVAIIALPLRTYQYLTNIEASTGFFVEKNIGVWALYALMAVICLFSIIYGLTGRRKFALDFSHERRAGCGIVSALLAVLAIGDSLSCFNHTLDLRLDFILSAQYPDALEPAREKIVTSVINLEGLTAVAAAVFFAASALSFISGKSVGEKLRLLSLAPVLWCVARIVYRFSITISYLRVSQLTIEMFMLIFCILFFMTYAQVNSKVNAKGLDWKIVAYGFPAAFFALLSFVPQFVLLLAGKEELLYMYSVPYYCDFGIALFALAIVITRIRIKEKDEEPEVVEEAAPEAVEEVADEASPEAAPEETSENAEDTGEGLTKED